MLVPRGAGSDMQISDLHYLKWCTFTILKFSHVVSGYIKQYKYKTTFRTDPTVLVWLRILATLRIGNMHQLAKGPAGTDTGTYIPIYTASYSKKRES
jgi:hypothetical protein